ncbi:hypothetical protein MKZ38_010521 [Zalerion maritima]|uniref:25S rRNA (Uridine(2843)-N(3))-methyltransferase n=1 Tax=Zalerion maritima TaxID=339359 RepID=A0AAD5RTU2_9PEZI|nr:hypothetical protein MKZ38_010521 [Zalerion maritima]
MPKKQGTAKGPKANSKALKSKLEANLPPPRSFLPPNKTTTGPAVLLSQQRILDAFSSAYSVVLRSKLRDALLQEIKTALFNRDFSAAFGKEEYLGVYAARWSPTRALCYAQVLHGMRSWLREGLVVVSGGTEVPEGNSDTPLSDVDTTLAMDDKKHSLRILSIGGTPAELAAAASVLSETLPPLYGNMSLLDSGPWGPAIDKLKQHLTTAPELSPYASASAKTSNDAVISPERLTTNFVQKDVLDLLVDELGSLLQEPCLVTLFFTLNELYTSAGIGKSTAFLLRLSKVIQPNSLLLVVDSPGSYSETAVGKAKSSNDGEEVVKKKYPMHWLLEHTLFKSVEDASNRDMCKWERLESKDSVWFRLDGSLKYPMKLEDMRYQMHLYKALTREDDE